MLERKGRLLVTNLNFYKSSVEEFEKISSGSCKFWKFWVNSPPALSHNSAENVELGIIWDASETEGADGYV